MLGVHTGCGRKECSARLAVCILSTKLITREHVYVTVVKSTLEHPNVVNLDVSETVTPVDVPRRVVTLEDLPKTSGRGGYRSRS